MSRCLLQNSSEMTGPNFMNFCVQFYSFFIGIGGKRPLRADVSPYSKRLPLPTDTRKTEGVTSGLRPLDTPLIPPHSLGETQRRRCFIHVYLLFIIPIVHIYNFIFNGKITFVGSASSIKNTKTLKFGCSLLS